MNKPQHLTNNNIIAVLDFAAEQKTPLTLHGVTVAVGGKTYTFGTNVFVNHSDTKSLIPPHRIAEALAAAITFDPISRGFLYNSELLDSANKAVTAYAAGSVLTICSRDGESYTVSVGGGIVTTPSVPGGSATSTLNDFAVATITTSEVAVTALTAYSSVAIENLSDVDNLLVRKAGGAYQTIFPKYGKVYDIAPHLLLIKSSAGTVNVQYNFKG